MKNFKKIFGCLSISAGVLFGNASFSGNCKAINPEQTQRLIQAIREDVNFSNFISKSKELSEKMKNLEEVINAKHLLLTLLKNENVNLGNYEKLDLDELLQQLQKEASNMIFLNKLYNTTCGQCLENAVSFFHYVVEFILSSNFVDLEDKEKLELVKNEKTPFDILAQQDENWLEFSNFVNDLDNQWSYFDID